MDRNAFVFTAPLQQQLLFGDNTKPSVSSVSSPFPQQPHTTPPLRRKINQSETRPLSSVFPWERDDTRSTPRGKATSTHTSSPFTCSDVITDTSARDDGIEEELRKEIDGKSLCHRERLFMKLEKHEKVTEVCNRHRHSMKTIHGDVQYPVCYSSGVGFPKAP